MGELSDAAVERLIVIIATSENPASASVAADALGGVGQLSDGAVERLIVIIATSENPDIARAAADALRGVGQLSDATVARLNEMIATSEDPESASAAADALRGVGQLSDAAAARLMVLALSGADYRRRVRLLNAVAGTRPTERNMRLLLERLTDEDNDVRNAAGNALVTFAANGDGWRTPVERALVAAVRSPDFATPDRYEDRPGQDYAYDALWRVTQNSSGSA